MVIGAVIGGLAPIGLQAGVAAEVGRVRSPKIKPGEFLRTALEIQALSEAGQTPVLQVDPFTGGQVLSTSDQSGVVFDILGSRFASAALAGTPEESGAIFRAREAFIESRRNGTALVPEGPTLRDQVIAALTTSTAKVVAPGVVERKTSSLVTPGRLGGPCAGANTGFSRLNCARGGFT